MVQGPREATELLIRWSNGHGEALTELTPLVYGELRRLAKHYFRSERPDHTLQPTALVNEAYFRLMDQTSIRWQNRAHFLGIAANLMRQILVNHALSHRAAKRGGTAIKLTLDDAVGVSKEQELDLAALDQALTRLATFDSRQGIVELRLAGFPSKKPRKFCGFHPLLSNGNGPWPKLGSIAHSTKSREWSSDK